MKLIAYYSYYGSMTDPLDALHDQAKSGVNAIICRVRMSRDNVPVIFRDSSMAQLCQCDERMDELTFREIDALMQLGNRRLLTLEQLLSGYRGELPLILHYRGFVPDPYMLQRTAMDPRFLFGSDSVKQIGMMTSMYPQCSCVGFVSHVPVADEMIRAGARAVCLYGREIALYKKDRIPKESDQCSIWFDVPREPACGLDMLMEQIRDFGGSGIAVPFEYIR